MSATGPLHSMRVASRVLQILLASVGGLALIVDTLGYWWLRSGTFVLHVSDPDRAGRQVSFWTGTRIDSAVPVFLWLPSLLSWAVIVLWLIWQHGSTANLWARGYRDLKIRPGWAVGWWFIPFANYVMPLVAMFCRRISRLRIPVVYSSSFCLSDGLSFVASDCAWPSTRSRTLLR